MKIKANAKDNTVEFIPEKDIDCFHLGMVFGQKSHSLTVVTPDKLKVVTAKTSDIWIYLLRESFNVKNI